MGSDLDAVARVGLERLQNIFLFLCGGKVGRGAGSSAAQFECNRHRLHKRTLTHCANMKDWERLLPAANMGEYEPPRERPEDGGLCPLNAEGTYGRVPKNRNPGRWQELPKYQKREKKPKLYASYAISDKCELHSLVLDKYMRPPKCSVHTSGSGRSSRATSAPPQSLAVTEVKEKSVEKSNRQASLPPVDSVKLTSDESANLKMEKKKETYM